MSANTFPQPSPAATQSSEGLFAPRCELSRDIKLAQPRKQDMKQTSKDNGWARLMINGKILELKRNPDGGWNPILAKDVCGTFGGNWTYTGQTRACCQFIKNGRLLPNYRLSECMQIE